MDTKYTKIIKSIYEKCAAVLNKPIVSEKLVKRISTFLDAFLAECIGEKEIVDADKLQRLEKFYNNVREDVLISNEEIQKTLSEKLASVDEETKKLKESLNEALMVRIKLTEELNAKKKDELLAIELKECTPEVAKRVRTLFEKSSYAEVKTGLSKAIVTVENEINVEHSEAKHAAPLSETIKEGQPAAVNGEVPQNIMDIYVNQIKIHEAVSK